MAALQKIATSHHFLRYLNKGKRFYSAKNDVLPKNVLKEKGLISADAQTENGTVYDKRPFKITLEAGKNYSWCLCGRSKAQPFCDGTHRFQELKIRQKPIRFQVAETKDYWLCNCKQTSNRPFCDGTHKLPKVQEATSTIKY